MASPQLPPPGDATQQFLRVAALIERTCSDRRPTAAPVRRHRETLRQRIGHWIAGDKR